MLGTFDSFLLWTTSGSRSWCSSPPRYLGLSLKQALLATLVGGLIGNTMLGVAALIGADARVPTMVLQRAPLGQRGSYLATASTSLQCLGWATFELIIIATAASALGDGVRIRSLWFWKLVFGVVATFARAARTDRLRAPLRPQVRDLGGDRLDPLPRVPRQLELTRLAFETRQDGICCVG